MNLIESVVITLFVAIFVTLVYWIVTLLVGVEFAAEHVKLIIGCSVLFLPSLTLLSWTARRLTTRRGDGNN